VRQRGQLRRFRQICADLMEIRQAFSGQEILGGL